MSAFHAEIVSIGEEAREVRTLRLRVQCVARREEMSEWAADHSNSDAAVVEEAETAVRAEDFHFREGQWVDFFIPGIKHIGGFTITSARHAPKQLASLVSCASDPLQFDLAIQRSRHPAASWVHSDACAPGARVIVKTGGVLTLEDCVMERKEGGGAESFTCSELLLVAGGLGINPLYSILLRLAAIMEEKGPEGVPQITLVYSGKAREEMLYLEEALALARGLMLHRLRVVVCETGAAPSSGANRDLASFGTEGRVQDLAGGGLQALLGKVFFFTGRIDEARLRFCTSGNVPRGGATHVGRPAASLPRDPPSEGGEGGKGGGLAAMICGPPSFTDEVDRLLQLSGLDPAHIHYEKWW